jgi:solute:Na+ symporter, SSS family
MTVSTPVLGMVVLIYLMVAFYIGWVGYRKTRDTDDFILAGRKINSYVLALSYGETFISTSAIVGFGGAAGIFGMGLLWLTFTNVFVEIFIAFVVFGSRTRRIRFNLKAVTFPDCWEDG